MTNRGLQCILDTKQRYRSLDTQRVSGPPGDRQTQLVDTDTRSDGVCGSFEDNLLVGKGCGDVGAAPPFLVCDSKAIDW